LLLQNTNKSLSDFPAKTLARRGVGIAAAYFHFGFATSCFLRQRHDRVSGRAGEQAGDIMQLVAKNL